MTRTLTHTALSTLTDSPRLPLIANWLVSVACRITIWDQRRRSRIDLKSLDDHLLEDIGVTQFEARKEAARPFWQI